MPDEPTQGDTEQQSQNIEDIKTPVTNGVNETVNNQTNSPEQNSSPNDPESNNGNNTEAIRKGWIERKHPIISTIANVIMAFGTMGAFWIAAQSLKLTRQALAGSDKKDSAIINLTKRLADATDIQAKATVKQDSISGNYTGVFKEIMQSQNRADIEIGEVVIAYSSVNFGTVTLKNAGQTDAINIRYAIDLIRIDANEFYNPNFDSLDRTAKYHTPFTERWSPGHIQKIPIIGERWSGPSGPKRKHILISVEYYDIFGVRHIAHKHCIFTDENSPRLLWETSS